MGGKNQILQAGRSGRLEEKRNSNWSFLRRPMEATEGILATAGPAGPCGKGRKGTLGWRLAAVPTHRS